jgi:hypothetical protein
VDDSDRNQARRSEENNCNPEAEVAPVPRALASFLYESLLVQAIVRGGVPGLLNGCYGLLPLPLEPLTRGVTLRWPQ